MTKISVIGIGDNGLDSLTATAREKLEAADCVFGAKRHFENLELDAEMVAWPSPFDHLVAEIHARSNKAIVVLATGDPLWFSVGCKLAEQFRSEDIEFFPQVSSFQLAATRLKWSLQDCECISLHGRPIENLVQYLQPNQQVLCLTGGSDAPARAAEILVEHGFGASQMHVLGHIGGKLETHVTAKAKLWDVKNVSELHVLAVEVVPGEPMQFIAPCCGLKDDAFRHDGKMTKRIVRAATLTKLMPHRNALLWDVGAGSGSVSIEWMRAAKNARAIALEPRTERCRNIEENARKLGTPSIEIKNVSAPEGLEGLPEPDAIFLGGGLKDDVLSISMDSLKLGGRLVVNAVTLESEAILLAAFQNYGGELERISVEKADQIGPRHGWRPAMAVTQWNWKKQ